MDEDAVLTTLSILIPTRNRRTYLTAALDSARSTSGIAVEILVSDDGSTDGTIEMIRTIGRADPRVRLLPPNPRPGIFENVAHLISHVRSELFTVLGDDDLLDPSFGGEVARPLIEDTEVIVAFCDHRVIDGRGRALPRASTASSHLLGRASLPAGRLVDPVRVALDHGIWLGFSVYRTAAFADEPFDPSCGPAADWDMAIRAARKGPIVFVAGRHGSYRDHDQTASRASRLQASIGAVRVLKKHRFASPEHEAHRIHLLRDATMRLAFQQTRVDADAARATIREFRSLGGTTTLHIALASALIRGPRALRAPIHEIVRRIGQAKRTVTRAIAP